MLSVNLLVKVFEQWCLLHRSTVLPYSPFNSNAESVCEGQKPGVPDTGKKYPMEIVNVDPAGKTLNGKSRVIVEWYKVRGRWWWDDVSNDLSNFNGRQIQ
jgi:hypothetical protein